MKAIKYLIGIFIFSLGSLFGILILQQTNAFQLPPSPPPQHNAPAPINISSSNQTKIGGITLGKDLWIDPNVSTSSEAGLKLFSTTGDFWSFNNDLSVLKLRQGNNTSSTTLVSIDSGGNTNISGNLNVNGDIRANGNIYSSGKLVLTSESDPVVDRTQAFDGKYCKWNLARKKIECNVNTNSVDTRIGSLNSGKWCYSNGSQIICDRAAPIISEQDPKVGNLGGAPNNWCKANAGKVECNSPPPASPYSLIPVYQCPYSPGTAGESHHTNSCVGALSLNPTCDTTDLSFCGSYTCGCNFVGYMAYSPPSH